MNFPNNEKINKFVSFNSTVGGLDKTMELISYLCQLYNYTFNPQKNLSNLSSLLSDTRYAFRLTGILSTLNSLLPKEKDHYFTIKLLQNLSMIIYYPCDNGYWLSSKGVLNINTDTRNKMSRISCQMWALYMILDIYINMKEKDNTSLFLNLLCLPLALEWSLEKGFLPSYAVPILGTTNALITFYLKYKK